MSVTPPRERSRRGEGDQLRDDLLAAASDLLAEHGSVDKVSLRAVANRTGVSPTAVYRHFENHDELMAESVLWCWRELDNALSAVSDGPDEDPFECFTKMGQAYMAFALAEPGRYKVLFTRDLMELNSVKEMGLQVFARLVGLVDRMFAVNGDTRDSFFVASQVHTWLHGIIELCRDPREVADDNLPFPTADELLAHVPAALGLERVDS